MAMANVLAALNPDLLRILVGHVGKDPDVRYSQSGTPVANFSLAPTKDSKIATMNVRADRVSQHRGLAAFGGDHWGEHRQRLQTLRRGKDVSWWSPNQHLENVH
jgi:hypothetical protein